MPFKSIKDLVDKVVEGGQSHRGTFRKTMQGTNTSSGLWYDFSMYPGHPVTNFYASTPLVAATLLSREGIQLGQNVSPNTKYLKSATMMSASPSNFVILDYLLYYPFIDGDSTDEQLLDNTVTLPRYTDGRGVKAMLVSQGTYTGNAAYRINYTNQNGVSGRISQRCTTNTWGSASCVVSSGNSGTFYPQFGWHIPLAEGDTGIRSVESITFENPNGGILALVLVQDLGCMSIRENSVPAEKDFLINQGMNMPVIQDGAYIGMIGSGNASLAVQVFYGNLQSIWG
jgi:hypothetical protein